MAESVTTFEINRDIIDFGDRIVAVRQIASAGCRRSHPVRLAGLGLMVFALAGLAYEAAMNDGMAALRTGGSTKLWLAFVLAGIAVFAIVYQRRALVIALADGSKIRLQGGTNDFQERVVACIGDAMKSSPDETFRVVVDLRAQTIGNFGLAGHEAASHPTAAPRSPPSQTSAHTNTQPQARTIDGADVSPTTRLRPHYPGQQYPAQFPASGESANGLAHEPIKTRSPMPVPGTVSGWPTHTAIVPTDAAPVTHGAHSVGVSGPITPTDPHPALRPQRDASNPLRDMDTLIDFVRRSDIQHKSALLELLAVAQDYLQGGATVRDDAIAHWQSFSGYVHQYLVTVDGLLLLTERAGRPFAAL